MTIQRKKTIKGNEYEATLFLGSRSLQLFQEIKKDIESVLTSISVDDLAALDSGALNGFIELNKGASITPDMAKSMASLGLVLGKAVMAFGKNRSTSEYESLVKSLLELTTVNGKQLCNKDTFNEHFAGKMGELHMVLVFVIKENFGDFFSVGQGASGLLA